MHEGQSNSNKSVLWFLRKNIPNIPNSTTPDSPWIKVSTIYLCTFRVFLHTTKNMINQLVFKIVTYSKSACVEIVQWAGPTLHSRTYTHWISITWMGLTICQEFHNAKVILNSSRPVIYNEIDFIIMSKIIPTNKYWTIHKQYSVTFWPNST